MCSCLYIKTLVTAPTPSPESVLLVILHLLSWSFLYLPFQHLLCIKCLRSVGSLQVVCSCLSDSSSEPPTPPPTLVFFLHQPNFSLHICEGANDSLTGMLSDRRCLSSGGASAFFLRACMCVLIYVCVREKVGGGGYCQDVTGTLCMFSSRQVLLGEHWCMTVAFHRCLLYT